jgi:NTE family protein
MLHCNIKRTPIEDQTMDAVSSREWPQPRHPEGCDKIALVLQGGGALGAYQAGVYQAMHEAGLWPDSVAGVSIGGINGAIIAGNRPERRLERLRAFWETVTAGRGWPWLPEGDAARKTYNLWSSLMTVAFGQPGFFTPRAENAWFSPRGTRSATAFYDTEPLRETLLRLVDFDVLNNGDVRYAAGSVNVATGNFVYFDSAQTTIAPEHVMASGALPPALPMVRIGSDYFWDGGLVSNTPLQQIVDNPIGDHVLVFQVDLFSALGAVPRDMPDVLGRQKDIQFSSRTRLVTDYFKRLHTQDRLMKRLLERLPDDTLDANEKAEKNRLAHMSSFTILQLIYQQAAYEGQAKDYEFSGTSMRDHWDSGYQDTQRTLAHKDWLTGPDTEGGVETHDIHREEQ